MINVFYLYIDVKPNNSLNTIYKIKLGYSYFYCPIYIHKLEKVK